MNAREVAAEMRAKVDALREDAERAQAAAAELERWAIHLELALDTADGRESGE